MALSLRLRATNEGQQVERPRAQTQLIKQFMAAAKRTPERKMINFINDRAA
jgi:hypothetical protein